jgi:hypothetical protein
MLFLFFHNIHKIITNFFSYFNKIYVKYLLKKKGRETKRNCFHQSTTFQLNQSHFRLNIL